MARAAISTPPLPARAQASELTVNTTRPTMKILRRPRKSASLPAESSSTANASAYALTVHWSWESPIRSSPWIAGSATFTTVRST